MRSLFDEQAQDGYGLLLMDAVNAFNFSQVSETTFWTEVCVYLNFLK